MKIKSIQGGFDKNLSYLLWCKKTKIGAIIDPAIETTYFEEIINKNNLIINKILITHTHHDHILHLDSYLYLYPNAEVICHTSNMNQFNCQFKMVDDCEIIPIGEESLIAIHTPGHYIDSICYWDQANKLIFTGDTMFVGRTGRVKSNHSNIKDLYNSVYQKLLTLPESTMIYPGHHYGFTKSISIKDNIQLSNFFSCKSLKEFKIVMEKFESSR